MFKFLAKLCPAKEGELIRLGSRDCGWTVPLSSVSPGSVAVCIGAGEDVSFDVALNLAQMDVFCFDPTPRAIDHVSSLIAAAKTLPQKWQMGEHAQVYDLSAFKSDSFHFIPFGIWEVDDILRFYYPKSADHVSHSVMNIQETEKFFEAKCLGPESLQRLVGSEVAICKIDVEGAEYRIIKSFLAKGFLPKTVCVEFDSVLTNPSREERQSLLSCIEDLRAVGYKPLHFERANGLFSLE